MFEHNEDNCAKLAESVIESWDLKDVISYAIETLTNTYIQDKEAFDNDKECMDCV